MASSSRASEARTDRHALLTRLADLYERVLGDLANDNLEAAEAGRLEADRLIAAIGRIRPPGADAEDPLANRIRLLLTRILAELEVGQAAVSARMAGSRETGRALRGYRRGRVTTGLRLDVTDTP